MVFGTGHTPQGRRPIAFKIDGPLTTWYTDNLFLRDQATYFRVNGQLTLMGPSYLLYEAGLLTSTREGSNSSIEENVIALPSFTRTTSITESQLDERSRTTSITESQIHQRGRTTRITDSQPDAIGRITRITD